MAKECIKSCPRIKEILESIGARNFFSGPLAIHPDFIMGSNSDRLIAACEDTYKCSGPRETQIEVLKGVINVHYEKKKVYVCGLEK